MRTNRPIIHLLLSLAGVFFCLYLPAQSPGDLPYQDRPGMPAGVRGERVQALLGTLNEYSPQRLEAFLEKHCAASFRKAVPMEEHQAIFRSTARETGGLDFHGIRTYTPPRPGQLVVIARDRNFQSWRGLLLALDEEDRIIGLNFSPARTPSDVAAPPAIDEAGMLREVNALMDRLCGKDLFSGTLLIARDGQVLLERACGEASKSFHVPNNLDTRFNLGSMNKMFTATAVVQLAEQGKLSYDDVISRWVDSTWLPRDITDRVTVHHLLTHTSGLGSYFNDTYWRSSRELYRQLDDYKPLIRDEKLAFTPGERFSYSNTGLFLLGVIIEHATGENYFDYIREHIYGPAGMTRSDCYELDYPIDNLAEGYIPAPGSPWGWQNNLFKHVLKGGPAGGGYSTVRDLHRFAQALLGGKLVSRASLDKMWVDYAGARYGYGFQVEEGGAGRVVGHGGGFPGLNSSLDIYLDKGLTVAVMSNYDRGAGPLAAKIRELIGRMKG